MQPAAEALKECLLVRREPQDPKKRQEVDLLSVHERLTKNAVDCHEIIAATVVEAVEVLVLHMSSSQSVAAL